MSATADVVDLEQISREAESDLQDLRARRQRLTLDAITDPKAAKELADVESDMAVAGQTLERAALARQERARRDAQAVEDAETEQRAAALARARELEAERRALAAKVDRAAKAYAEALRAWDLVTTEQERALNGAGWTALNARAVRPRPIQIERSLRYALKRVGMPQGAIRFEMPMEASLAPLAEIDARMIEPEER